MTVSGQQPLSYQCASRIARCEKAEIVENKAIWRFCGPQRSVNDFDRIGQIDKSEVSERLYGSDQKGI